MKLPSGAFWRLRIATAAMALDESAYLGRRGESRRSQQLVVAGNSAVDPIVKWALSRETRR